MSPYLTILLGFALLLLLVLALDALGRAGREPFHPLAEALDAAMATRVGRWLVLGAWLWIGFHFLAR
jgi:hypothetical protein